MEPSGYSKRLKKTHTGMILACLFVYGMAFAIVGGTLDDLQDIYKISTNGVSQILVTRSAGTLVGSFLSGSVLYKHMNGKLVIVLSLLAGGLGTVIVPDFAPYFWVAHLGQFVTGFSYGSLEIGANVWLVQLWEDGIDPIMQSYHVSYGMGSFIGPLLTTPFLGPDKNKTLNATMEERLDIFNLDPDVPTNGTSHIAIPYAVYGGGYSLMGLVILALMFVDRSALRQSSAPETDEASHHSTLKFEWTVVGLLCAFIVAECTFETIMGSMLPLYVMRNPDLAMLKPEANLLLSLYYATFLLGRVASIFASFKLRPQTNLIIAQSITLLGAGLLLLVIIPGVPGRAIAWLATAIIGFGLGPLYPSAFTWTVRYVQLKYSHMSAALVAACLGGFLPTYLVAPWVESSTTAMPGVSAGCGGVLLCMLVAMIFTTRNRCPIYEQDDVTQLVTHEKE